MTHGRSAVASAEAAHPLARRALGGLSLAEPVGRDALLAGKVADHLSNCNPYGGEFAWYPPATPLDLQGGYADFLRDTAGASDLGPDNVLLTEGSAAALELLVRAFGEPGHDHVAVTPPTFAFFARAARVNDLAVVEVPLTGPDLDRLDPVALVASRPKLVFLCRPNNPVGTAIDLSVVEEVALAGSLVVVDEAYIEFAAIPSAVALLHRCPNLVVTRTFSKAWGLAGARVGVVVARPEVLAALRLVQLPYAVGSPAQTLARAALANPAAMRARVDLIVRDRESLRAALQGLPGVRRVYPSHANFLLVELIDRTAVLAVVAALAAAGIAVADTSSDVPSTIRVSVGRPDTNRHLIETLRVTPVPPSPRHADPTLSGER